MGESVHHDDALVHRALSDPSRARILAALQEHPAGLDAGQLAEVVGLHPNTIRSHLRRLEEAGLVSARRDAHGQPGRPHILFAARPESREADAQDSYRVLAGIFAHHLATSDPSAGPEAEAAGTAWGAAVARTEAAGADPISEVVGLLQRLGFEPSLEHEADAEQRIVMNACAFGDLVDEYDEVVCSVHLGLIRGALAGLGADLDATELDRDSDPGRCVACLTPRDAA